MILYAQYLSVKKIVKYFSYFNFFSLTSTGTTINTLKFPVINSKTNWLMAMRRRRLHETKAKDMLRHVKDGERTRNSKKLMASSKFTTLRGNQANQGVDTEF